MDDDKYTYIYIDTCSLNKLAYLTNYDYIFKKLEDNNYRICISEVNIFEIMRDADDPYNRDRIITMLQSSPICLLPSVWDIIMNYVDKDYEMPNTGNQVIIDVLSNKELEFKVSDENKLKLKKEEYKLINKLIKSIPKCDGCENYYCDVRIDSVAYIFASLFLICGEYYIDLAKDDCFWKNKINLSVKEKMKIIKKKEKLIIKNNLSPFRNMARFAILQDNKLSRGTFNDSVQIVFLDYVDLVVSDDKHFKDNIKRCISLDKLMELIQIKIIWDEDQKLL